MCKKNDGNAVCRKSRAIVSANGNLLQWPALQKCEGRPFRPPSLTPKWSRSAFLEPVFLMATAAIVLAYVAQRRLQTIDILHARGRSLGVFAELGKARLEVGHI